MSDPYFERLINERTELFIKSQRLVEKINSAQIDLSINAHHLNLMRQQYHLMTQCIGILKARITDLETTLDDPP